MLPWRIVVSSWLGVVDGVFFFLVLAVGTAVAGAGAVSCSLAARVASLIGRPFSSC